MTRNRAVWQWASRAWIGKAGGCQEGGCGTGREADSRDAMCAFIWRHMSRICWLGLKGWELDGRLTRRSVVARLCGGFDSAGTVGLTN